MHRRGRSSGSRIGGVAPRKVTPRMTLLVLATALCLVVFSKYARTKSSAPLVDGAVVSASGGGRGTGGVRHPSTLPATTTNGPPRNTLTELTEQRSVITKQRSVREATDNYLRGREARQQDRRNKRYMGRLNVFAADPKETTDRPGNAAVAVATPPEQKNEEPSGFGTASSRNNGFDKVDDEKEAGAVGMEKNYNSMAVAAAEAAAEAAAAAAAMMQKGREHEDDSYVRYVERINLGLY
ncbi:unnamed protein product [Ectocarpus sp. 8 AP-2014]